MHMIIYTYTKHTHKYKVNVLRLNQLTRLYNGSEVAAAAAITATATTTTTSTTTT